MNDLIEKYKKLTKYLDYLSTTEKYISELEDKGKEPSYHFHAKKEAFRTVCEKYSNAIINEIKNNPIMDSSVMGEGCSKDIEELCEFLSNNGSFYGDK